jgi:hypothetical protein
MPQNTSFYLIIISKPVMYIYLLNKLNPKNEQITTDINENAVRHTFLFIYFYFVSYRNEL